MDLGGVETGRVYSCYCRLIHRIFMGSYVYPDDMKLHLVDNTEIVKKKKKKKEPMYDILISMWLFCVVQV